MKARRHFVYALLGVSSIVLSGIGLPLVLWLYLAVLHLVAWLLTSYWTDGDFRDLTREWQYEADLRRRGTALPRIGRRS